MQIIFLVRKEAPLRSEDYSYKEEALYRGVSILLGMEEPRTCLQLYTHDTFVNKGQGFT